MNNETKNIEYWKDNAKEDYIKTPISVLRYITELEKLTNQEQKLPIDLVIERLESLKSYDMFCGYGGDLDVDKCDLNKGDYIKREDLEEFIEQMKANAL